MTNETSQTTEMSAALREVFSKAGCVDNANTIALMSQDIWSKGENAAFIATPENVEQLTQIVKLAHENGVALNPRGGGMSYTNGYTPDRKNVGLLDLSRLNKIIEINANDMYISVQAGVTWVQIDEALKPLGLRTPFWGPLSGLSSTIGGGLSQNNAFFGAGTYGPSTESVTSVTVVLADGTVVKTGSAGTNGGSPFWRHYGPDLTGLFLGDAGALGFKAEATFRLIPRPEFEDWASFEFKTQQDSARATAEVARQNIASEVFGFDPNLTKIRLKRASLLADVKTLGNVIKGQGSLLKGLKEGAKIALAGRDFVEANTWSLHFVVEGRSQAGVKEDMKRLRDIVAKHNAEETENSIPKIIRSNPFAPLNTILGPEGERWVPVHGIVPMSKAETVWDEIQAMFASRKDVFEKHKIETGYLTTTLSTNGFLIEPVFIWPEEIFAIHEATIEQSVLKKTKRHAPNPEVTALVADARKEVVAIFQKHGAAHFQIGRTYPYSQNRIADSQAMLEKIKAAIDPNGTVNPGSLGLG
ncbi:FAD-binding oxidoreductase [Hirschia litorea]|uniref:FAD-binding oxidoreductase n=1 Tax=Hirschia litorea TaxID=1199156 RepID=A0ABW2IHF4_9PROT